jgi:hypothetical protein
VIVPLRAVRIILGRQIIGGTMQGAVRGMTATATGERAAGDLPRTLEDRGYLVWSLVDNLERGEGYPEVIHTNGVGCS